MKIDLAIEQVAEAEEELADALERIGERHRVDHDVFHMTGALAKMSRARIRKLADHAASYGTSVDDDATEPSRGGLLTTFREKTSELIGSSPPAGLVLLRDLRELHLLAAAASINWTILGQGAQAVKDERLLATVSECHDEELRTLKWTTTHIKVTAPQVLAS